MYNILFLFAILFRTTARGNLFINEHNFMLEDILFDKLLSDIRIEPKLDFYVEPTTEPTIESEPSPNTLSPSIEPTLEPSFEPSVYIDTLKPSMSIDTMKPSVQPSTTLEPSVSIDTLKPTTIPNNYKVLDFSVNIEIVNCTTNQLDEYNQNVLLYAFSELTDINREYLSLYKPNLRRLYIFVLENTYYVLYETIYISIPLINQYTIYEANHIGLYNSLIILISDVIDSGLLVYTVKEYNTTIFDNSVVSLLDISEPTVITVRSRDSSEDTLSNTDIVLIVVLSIVGAVFCIFIGFTVSPKIHGCNTSSMESHQYSNKVYSVGAVDESKTLVELLDESPRIDVSEESRIVEAANTECAV